MKVCFFIGSYTAKEEKLLKKILELQNVEVIECRENIHNFASFISANIKMFFQHFKLSYDVMIIPWWGIFTFPLAKIVCRKPIIYWSNLSIYHTLIEDRKKIKPASLKAKFIHFGEKFACKHSTLVITESQAQADHLVKEYDLDKRNFRICINGVDETIFSPLSFKTDDKVFSVLFFGGFVPAHGTETIVEAARILSTQKDIIFYFYGDGPMKKTVESQVKKYKLKNVNLKDFIEQKALVDVINQSDVCLGIFGKSEKAANVVTNKVLQILASQKPLITMESRATREINLKNGQNCILIQSGNPQELSEAILLLKNHQEKRKTISIEGYQLYLKNLSMNETGKRFVRFIAEVQTL